MIGLRTRIRTRQATDRDAGHLAVEELVEGLIERHGADAPLVGIVLTDARSEFRQVAVVMPVIDSADFIATAQSSLFAFERVLHTATDILSAGDRAGVPLLGDLHRAVVGARTQYALDSMRSHSPQRRTRKDRS